MINDTAAVMVIFSEPQVRHCKTAHFLKTFGPAALPEGSALAAMMGKFQFLVEGWDDDPNELYAIPEVRKFNQHFHRVWPYWFFFCDLRAETLTMMTLCLLPNLSGYKRLGEPKAAVEYDPRDLLGFIAGNWGPLNLMMERAGMSEMDIYNRSRDVFLHFKLPYDGQPQTKRNYVELEGRNAALGLAGEKLVMDYEHERLWRTGHRQLAERIEHVAASRGDHLGYDILSFEESGRERLIEVKTTQFGPMTPFFATRNEVNVSIELSDHYQLYRVFSFAKDARLFALEGAIGSCCELTPTMFSAVPR